MYVANIYIYIYIYMHMCMYVYVYMINNVQEYDVFYNVYYMYYTEVLKRIAYIHE